MLNPDGTLSDHPVIADARVTLSLPVESEGEDALLSLFDCVAEFHARAKQAKLFVYTVQVGATLYEVDWGDKTVREIPNE